MTRPSLPPVISRDLNHLSDRIAASTPLFARDLQTPVIVAKRWDAGCGVIVLALHQKQDPHRPVSDVK